MILFPAIDLKDGLAVRLQQGDMKRATVFNRDPAAQAHAFETMGFKAVAKHRHKHVTLYRQGGVNFIINAESDSFAQRFARLHGPSICAIAFRVDNAAHAYQRALATVSSDPRLKRCAGRASRGLSARYFAIAARPCALSSMPK